MHWRAKKRLLLLAVLVLTVVACSFDGWMMLCYAEFRHWAPLYTDYRHVLANEMIGMLFVVFFIDQAVVALWLSRPTRSIQIEGRHDAQHRPGRDRME